MRPPQGGPHRLATGEAMRRNIFDVPKWHLIQHRDARGLPLPAANDAPSRRLEDELFERLYAGECDRLPEAECVPALRAWAERIHASCEALPRFSRLAAECRGDVPAASAAVEELRDATAGLAGVGFAPGTSMERGSAGDGQRAQPLAARLRGDARL